MKMAKKRLARKRNHEAIMQIAVREGIRHPRLMNKRFKGFVGKWLHNEVGRGMIVDMFHEPSFGTIFLDEIDRRSNDGNE